MSDRGESVSSGLLKTNAKPQMSSCDISVTEIVSPGTITPKVINPTDDIGVKDVHILLVRSANDVEEKLVTDGE
jgi:hypothetical protein